MFTGSTSILTNNVSSSAYQVPMLDEIPDSNSDSNSGSNSGSNSTTIKLHSIYVHAILFIIFVILFLYALLSIELH